ncbi:MAG: hypothetical protein J0I02_03200, partial [Alphaproteobacteria bacterium]|nr:hypothetical protein [Alphaproteobacteria bacterium]
MFGKRSANATQELQFPPRPAPAEGGSSAPPPKVDGAKAAAVPPPAAGNGAQSAPVLQPRPPVPPAAKPFRAADEGRSEDYYQIKTT